VDEPGPGIRGAHQGQRVVDGSHGLTEPELEPKRAMFRRQRWLCPERWAAVVVGAAMVGWQGRGRASVVVGRWRLQGGDGCRDEQLNPRPVLTSRGMGKCGKGSGEGWVEEVEGDVHRGGEGKGRSGGGAACSVRGHHLYQSHMWDTNPYWSTSHLYRFTHT
jgi:hypothetical protein